MWMDSTETDKTKAPTLPASGTLAFLTISTTGATAGQSYTLRLKGVATGLFPPAGEDTTLYNLQGLPVPATLNDGRIVILHTMTWTGANGNWTDASWTGSPPTYPNDSAGVVINPPNATPYTVTVNTPQRAYSVDVSNGGHLTVAAGSLTVVTGITYGTNDPEHDTPGTTTVQAGASLTAAFIRQDTLNVDGTVTVASSNLLASSDPLTALVWYASTVTDTNVAPTIRADGTLAYLDIDTTGATPGHSYTLRVQAVADKVWPGGLNTDFGLVTPTLNDGVITVQNPSPGATPAPEPATLVLVVLGGLCLGAYAWRRRLYFASATAGPGRVAVSSVETLAPDSCSLLKPDEVRLAFSLPERLMILDIRQRGGLPAGTG
jgi:hypothetical protein